MATIQKHAFKEEITFEITKHRFIVNFMNIGTYKIYIVHLHHIDMDTTHNAT